MGLEDREWWKDAQKERMRKENGLNQAQKPNPAPPDYFERLTTWGPFRIAVFWVVVSAMLYVSINYYMKPKPLTVSASGNLVIPRARDGNFYASGTISGKPVTFLWIQARHLSPLASNLPMMRVSMRVYLWCSKL